MFAIMVLFDFAGLMFAGFLVFVRLIVFVLGYKRAKLQIAQTTSPQAPLTNRQQTVQAEASPSHAPVVEQSPTPQTTIPQAPPLPAGKGSMSKGALVLLIVIVICATAAFLARTFGWGNLSPYGRRLEHVLTACLLRNFLGNPRG